MRDRIPCVYILANRFYGALYTGVTSNLLGRIVQHRHGRFDGHTRKHGIKLLMWYEVADTMEAAIITEKRIKKWRRDWKINLLERRNPHWEDLAIGLGLPRLPRHPGPDHPLPSPRICSGAHRSTSPST